MKKLLVIFIFFQFISINSFSQSNFQTLLKNGQDAEHAKLYFKAISIYKRAENQATKTFEKNRVYKALARNYISISEYSKALEYYNKLLNTTNGQTRKAIILNISDIQILLGQYQNAIDNLIGMNDAPDETIRLNNLAAAYSRLGKFNEAIVILDSALNKNTTSNHKIALQNKGYIFWQMGKVEKADSTLQAAIKLFDLNDAKRYICLANLAVVQAEKKDYTQAIKNIDESIDWQKKKLGEKHFDYITSLRKKAQILLTFKKTGDATKQFKIYFDKERQYIAENFAYMSENERLNFWFSQKPLVEQCFATENTNPNFLFDVAVFSKSLLVQANRNFEKLTSTNKNLSEIYQKILQKKSTAYTVDINSQKEIWQEIETMEKQLSEKLPSFKSFVNDIKTNSNDIRKKIKNNEFVLEFIRYNKDNQTKYAALLMPKIGDVKFIPLFTTDEIENFKVGKQNFTVNSCIISLNRESKNQLYSDTILSRKIWNNITKNIPQNSNIYFSPEGIFHNLAIEYICFDRPDLKLFRLSSSRVLCNRTTSNAKSALLVGGLDYNDTSSVIRHTDTIPNRLGSTILWNSGHSILWNYLSNSIVEIDSIYNVLKNNVKNPIKIIKGYGTEDYVKTNLPKADMALISTHGYSLGIMDTDNNKQINNNSIDSTMLLCGLVCSGANITSKQYYSNNFLEDGYLTALEISELNLSKLDLAVLSACQTGIGMAAPDGPSGIPRGLKKAGTNSIVVSLWDVDDLATRILMTHFFYFYNQGKTKYESLKLAQEKVRTFNEKIKIKTSQFSQSIMANITTEREIVVDYLDKPYFWAAFILIDGI